MPALSSAIPEGYDGFLKALKERSRLAQMAAAPGVNRELVLLCRSIGRDILARQKVHGWGARIVDRLAADLRREVPEIEGFSPRSLKCIGAFAQAWPDERFVQQVVAQISWGYNVRILDHVKNPNERELYVRQTVWNDRSRNVLVCQIESGFYGRQGKALTNFSRQLPAPQSELAQQVVRDGFSPRWQKPVCRQTRDGKPCGKPQE